MTNETKKPVTWYAAGRIERQTRERFGLINNMMDYDEPTHVAPIRAGEGFAYSGPFTYGCDHQCTHSGNGSGWEMRDKVGLTGTAGTATHGSALAGCAAAFATDPSIDRKALYLRALDGIAKADAVFVWITDEECFGTLLEVGYAKALGKPIYLAHAPHIHPNGELWFSFQSASATKCFTDAHTAFAEAVASFISGDI